MEQEERPRRRSHLERVYPESVAMLRYLREHGPSDVLTMKMAGVEVPQGMVNRLHSEGLIRKVGRKDRGGSHPTWIWAVM